MAIFRDHEEYEDKKQDQFDYYEEPTSPKAFGITLAIITTIIYAIIIFLIASSKKDDMLYLAMFGCFLTSFFGFTFGYAIKKEYLTWVTPTKIYDAYNNPIDNYFKSEHDKQCGSIILPIFLIVPTLIFYYFFAWIFLFVKRAKEKKEAKKNLAVEIKD